MNNHELKERIEQELYFLHPNVEYGWQEIQNEVSKKRRHMYRMRPAIIVAILVAILVIPVGSVAAYGLFQRTYNLPQGKQPIRDEKMILSDNVVEVEEKRDGDSLLKNIELEWTGSYVKGAWGILTFRLKTVDGTPLIKDEPNKAPILFPLTFEQVIIKGNETVKAFNGYIPPHESIPNDYYLACTWIAEDLTSAEFELKLQNAIFDINNNDITIRLKNLMGIYHGFEDIDTTGTLGEILSTQEQGEGLHIEFSEEYPECYIDSYQFVSDKEYIDTERCWIIPTGKKMFMMTVKCDEASKDTIRHMVLQNVNTGFCATAEMPVRELEDGRLEFYYSVNYDGSYVNETYTSRGGERRDTTMEDLNQLVIKLGGKRIVEPILEGTMEAVITIE